MQVSQYLTFTVNPLLMVTSLKRGKRNGGLWPGSTFSGSGGRVLRGTIPGSLPEVTRSIVKTCKQIYTHLYNKLLKTKVVET